VGVALRSEALATLVVTEVHLVRQKVGSISHPLPHMERFRVHHAIHDAPAVVVVRRYAQPDGGCLGIAASGAATFGTSCGASCAKDQGSATDPIASPDARSGPGSTVVGGHRVATRSAVDAGPRRAQDEWPGRRCGTTKGLVTYDTCNTLWGWL
jgi:hypothetical protein